MSIETWLAVAAAIVAALAVVTGRLVYSAVAVIILAVAVLIFVGGIE